MAQDVWQIEQVVALAGRSARFAAGESLAVPSLWTHSGSSERALWGRYVGSAAEPYDVVVDHVGVAHRCTCPSRVHPCKHVIGLLVLWVRGHVARAPESEAVATWADRNAPRGAAPAVAATPVPGAIEGRGPGGPGRGADEPSPLPPPADDSGDRDRQRNERVERLLAGLVELDRWLEDRMRAGLADARIARFATWDDLAARLTDARAGALANRVRRLAGRVGASPDWHAAVLAELGILHLIATAGRHLPDLPSELADTVAVACGWQVRSADVAASAPESDVWLVAGRSDNREDLIEVRRVWLYGLSSRRWALVLSFAAYRQSLDASLRPGMVIAADLHRYPGNALRVIVGERSTADISGRDAAAGAAVSVAGACDVIGAAMIAEPWLERVPVVVRGAPTVSGTGPRAASWVVSDDTGSLPLAPLGPGNADALGVLVSASAGRPVTLAAEWTADGLVPLTVFLDDRPLDVGPRADASFVSAA